MGATQPASALFFLAILGMLAAVIVLFLGIRSMTEEPDTDPHRSEKPMLAQVGLQALTAALVVAPLAQR
jgi:hypothetical protein